MPKSRVVIYREEDRSAPFIDWFKELPSHAKDKVLVRIERLRDLGHELRRPEADFLRDGIRRVVFTTACCISFMGRLPLCFPTV
jgi:hypothetical protein